MTIHQNGMISYVTSPALERYGLVHGFFMRQGGCSPYPWKSLNMATSVGDTPENVVENRRRICETLSRSEKSIYDVWQIHSNHVINTELPRAEGEAHLQADGIITRNANVTILMLFADCVPIFFYDPIQSVIACVHAGWKGTMKKVASAVIKRMNQVHQCNVKDIQAVIGPCICQDHYEVREEVVLGLKKSFSHNEIILKTKNNQHYADLSRANEIILREIGLSMIEQSQICTACHNQDWFSHRAENGKTGRFAAVLTLEKR